MRLSLAALHKKERPDKHQVGAKTVSEPYCHHSPNHSGGSTTHSVAPVCGFFPQARALITAIHSLQLQAGKPMRNRTSKSPSLFFPVYRCPHDAKGPNVAPVVPSRDSAVTRKRQARGVARLRRRWLALYLIKPSLTRLPSHKIRKLDCYARPQCYVEGNHGKSYRPVLQE